MMELYIENWLYFKNCIFLMTTCNSILVRDSIEKGHASPQCLPFMQF